VYDARGMGSMARSGIDDAERAQLIRATVDPIFSEGGKRSYFRKKAFLLENTKKTVSSKMRYVR